MSGHSKWSTIKRQKGANDAKRGAIFTKLGNQIAVAARSGSDPSMNSALALAVERAKQANMPNDNIQRAIQRAADKSAAAMEEAMYEGYGPGGVAIIVECATDNKNRTYPDVRNAFNKNGGNIADAGSVSFQFERKGVVRAAFEGDEDEALLQALDAGADDANIEDGEMVVYTEAKQLHSVREKLAELGFTVKEAELSYVPNNSVEITDVQTVKKVLKLLDALEDLDDVVNVHSNFDADIELASKS